MNIRTRIALLTLLLLALFAAGTAQAEDRFVRAHALAFQMDADGVIHPVSHAFRERELEPKTEEELLAVLAEESTNPPVTKGHLAIRAYDGTGRVIYRTIESVILRKRIHSENGETLKVIEQPVFTTVVPVAAFSMTIEGWLPATRTTFYLSELAEEYGETNAATGRITTQEDPPPTTVTIAANRFNILFLGDGYLEADKQLFENDVAAVTSTLKGTHPYDRYAAWVDVKMWFDASQNRGAKHPTCADSATNKECDPDEKPPANWTNHNTAFGATYCEGSLQRGLEVDDSKVSAKVNAVVRGGRPEIVVVLVNDSVWGGTGGTYVTANSRQPNHAPHGTNRMNPYLAYTVMHEIGHILGLSDEYSSGGPIVGPPPVCLGECGPNVQPGTAAPGLAAIKWARWIDVPNEAAAIPTCTTAQHPACSHITARPRPVGLYEGAGYYASAAYRPEFACLMRDNATGAGKETCPTTGPATHRADSVTQTPPPYCRVCADVVIRELYEHVNPIDKVYEESHTSRLGSLIRPGATIMLGADVVPISSATQNERQTIRWKVNGQDAPEHTGKTSVPYTATSGANVNMEMIISDPTTAVRESAQHGFKSLPKPRNMSARSVKWFMYTPRFLRAVTTNTSEVIQTDEFTVPAGTASIDLKYAVNSQEPGDPNRPGDYWSIVVGYGGTQATAVTASAPLYSAQDTIKSGNQSFERVLTVPVNAATAPVTIRVSVRIRNLEAAEFAESSIEAEFSATEVSGCDAECEVCSRNPAAPGCPLTFKQLKAEMQQLEPNAEAKHDHSFSSIARSGTEKLDHGRHVRIETTPLPYAIFQQMDISVFVMTTFSEKLALIRTDTWKSDGTRTGGSEGMERVVQDGSVWKLNVAQKKDFGNRSLLANIPDDKWPFHFKYRIQIVVTAKDGRTTTSEYDVATIASATPPFDRPLKTLRIEDQGNRIEGIWHRWASIHAHRWFDLNRDILYRVDRIADAHGAYDTPPGHERGTAFTEIPFYPGANVWTNSSNAPFGPYYTFRRTVADLVTNPFWVARRETVVNWIKSTREHVAALLLNNGVAMVRLGDGTTTCNGPFTRPNDGLPEGVLRELLEYGRVTVNGTVKVDLTEEVGAAHWQPALGYIKLGWSCLQNHWYDVELDRCWIGELPGPCHSGRPPGMRITRIRTQPSGTSINTGQTATLAVEAEGEELRYRWYAGPAGNFTESRTVTGGDQPTLKVSPPETQQYWVYVWGGYGSATSDPALVTVAGTGTGPCKPPSITGQPPVVTYLDPETSTTLSVNATGTNLKFQWYYAATVDAPFAPISGAVSSSYELVSAAGRYHVRVQNSCGTVFSNSAYVVMNTSCAVPTITSKTLDRRVTLGDPLDLNVTATGKAPLSYSWAERLPDGSTRFIGATAALRVYPEVDGVQYIPTVGNECKYTTGEPVTIEVCFPPAVSRHPESKNIVRGQSATLEVAASGTAPLTVTWIDGDSKTVGSGLSATFAPQVTTTYYARVSNSCGQQTSFGAVVTVCHPPTITTPPQGKNLTRGESWTLSVVAGGTGPHGYQWFANGTSIDGATSSSLDVTPEATTAYHVVVTGECGTVTSSTATVNVCTPPQIARHPEGKSINAGQEVTLSVEATGTAPLTYALLDQNNNQLASGTSNSFTFVPSIPAGSTGRYRIRVTGGCGTPVTSNEATVSVCAPVGISVPPQSVSIVEGDSTTLSVTASGTEPYSYQWYQGSTALTGENDRTLSVSPESFTTYTVKVTNACGEITSPPANVSVTLRCIRPFIGTHPASSTITSGQSVNLTVGVSGSTPRSFQWYANGVEIPGAEQQTYSASPSATTSYHVVVTNDCGTATSDPAVITVESCELPVIGAHPEPDTIQSGQSKLLSVSATGATGYQWYANGSAIGGATSSTYNATPVATTSYHVVVSNSCGSVTSNPATITVGACEAPSIASPPQSISITSGQAHTLRVTASGTAPYSYQWYANGAEVSGATGSAYTVTPTATTSYYVVVSNACGTVTSPTATVAVNCNIPVINFHPQSGVIEPGQTVTLTVGAQGQQPFSYQWYANGSPVGNTISSSLQVSPTSTTSYYVVVSNTCGSSTSNTATITVASCLPATFTKRANNVSIAPGDSTTLAVQASGTGPISYVWRDENNNVIGTGTSVNVAPAVSTTYSVRISNDCGSDVDQVTVSVVECPLPVITVHPKSFSMTEGGRAFYEVVATSSTPLTYQWYANGVAMPGVTSRAHQIEPAETTSYFVDVTNACGTVRSEVGVVTVNPCTKPVFTTQPKDVTIVDGEAAVLSASATGTGPITYTLYDQDRSFVDSNSTGVFSVRPQVLAPYVWGYWISASNACGVIFSNGVGVTVLPACTAPSISSQPQGATIEQGGSATLSISASGSTPLEIRWFTSGGQQVGSGNSISVSPSSTTSYYAVVSNGCGERQSSTVTVNVTVPCTPPSISTPSADTFVLLRYGFSKTITVSASGDGLQYQWYQSQPAGAPFVAMPGKTGPSLTFSPDEDTHYRVRVFNDCGEVTSFKWMVTMWDGVGDPPTDPHNPI